MTTTQTQLPYIPLDLFEDHSIEYAYWLSSEPWPFDDEQYDIMFTGLGPGPTTNMGECKDAGQHLDLVDNGYATPDSGCIAMSCRHCGHEFPTHWLY